MQNYGEENHFTFQQSDLLPATQGLVGPLYLTARCNSPRLDACFSDSAHFSLRCRQIKQISQILFMSHCASHSDVNSPRFTESLHRHRLTVHLLPPTCSGRCSGVTGLVNR